MRHTKGRGTQLWQSLCLRSIARLWRTAGGMQPCIQSLSCLEHPPRVLPRAEAQYLAWDDLMLSANALGRPGNVCQLGVRLLHACLRPVPKQPRGLHAYYAELEVRG